MAAETKERILDVAERLFADFGFPVTSLRDITHEAGVNLAAVNYHFGSKQALLAAVLERRVRPINDRRLALLDELEKAAGSTSPELEDILRAFLGPPFYKQAEVEPPVLEGVDLPVTWTATEVPVGQIAIDWWTDFDDPGLSAAVETVLTHNYDLQTAAARLERAAADARAAAAGLRPTIQASYSGSRRQQNFVGFPILGGEDRVLSMISTNHGVSLDVSWEIDLWGRLRAGSQAALADLQRSAADLWGAQLSIAGQTVKAWFAIAEAQQQVNLSRQTVDSFRESEEQLRDRFEAGIRPALDLRLALLNLSNAEALLQQRLQQLDSSTRQLEVLLGQYPDGTTDTPPSLPATTPAVPSGLPADLVGRRPDLVAAERNLAASEARLGVARKELLPQISLTAATGSATNSLRSLINGDFSIWSLLGNIVAPLW